MTHAQIRRQTLLDCIAALEAETKCRKAVTVLRRKLVRQDLRRR